MQNTYVVAVTQPVITLWTALVWLRLTLAAAFCRLLPTRLRCPNLVVLYCNCVVRVTLGFPPAEEEQWLTA
jgi:hypothetical protein